ncbi:ceramidase [candidate division KSB1 bacterium]|nr:ceramidase [candidate division KSB1 bacterium]NIR68351.1 ceramidase [candidate division KSB1 bacterium]NIS28291.1 ceramidase [candidate division KSB1 bacterium]NIT75163.1 ceramidase [candidate division KSB1 bacterium]NIU28967.1 ceramidase [candidate division KSB1 bacterium]
MKRKRLRFRRIRKGFYLTLLFEKYGKWFIWELKRFFVPLALFIVIVSALVFISTKDFPWREWKLSQGFYRDVFCEKIRSGSIRQPFNAWSSLIFIPIGLWMARRAFLDKVPSPRLSPIRRHKRYGLLFGISLVITGVGSWFFHASLTYVGHFVDVIGMYFLGGFLFTYGLSRKLRQSATAFLAVYAAVVVPLVLFQWFNPEASRYAFGALILSALGIEIGLHKSLSNKLFVVALLTLGLGFFIWILDEKKLLCWPQSCLQGHAIWHILTAIATQLSYLYYLSEGPRVNWKIGYRAGKYTWMNRYWKR